MYLFTFIEKNVLLHVSKLRDAPKFALYQFGTVRCTLRPTACHSGKSTQSLTLKQRSE